ncbi:MAG: hypothetical protein IH999_03510 [Proteobacteria bacterium]|nr:hypothetical protein [Pseudomonadota bacterium]
MTVTPPAEGERRAAGGYTAQYRIAAALIYDGLIGGEIDWVRIADPNAGRVDDIQIGSGDRLDAYQVKWGEYARNITFNELTVSSGDEPSLIIQLTDGWSRLRSQNPEKRITVHLICRHQASTSDHVPVGDPPPRQRHLQAFIRHCWSGLGSLSPMKLSSVDPSWRPAVERLLDRSGLAEIDFFQFVRDCELHFAYLDPSNATYPLRDATTIRNDITRLADALWRLAGDESRIVEISADDLLARMGWEDRYVFRHQHRFPVDETLYVPVHQTVIELTNALDNLSRGYMALVGTPGSGKSTLLTQVLRYRQGCKVVRYYAFVRDDPSLKRGEASNFLHDIVLSLSKEGFRPAGSMSAATRDDLLSQFSNQLTQLNGYWRETGTKTIILVDGLDHIEREQSPYRTLLADLPLPNGIPEGVLFVLGTQTTDLEGLSDAIRTHLDDAGRTVTMTALSRPEVFKILSRVTPALPLSSEQKSKVYELSAGHPLALVYLIQRLHAAEEVDEVGNILESAQVYETGIEGEYTAYWSSLDRSDDLRRILSLLCRLRGPIILNRIAHLFDEGTMRRFVRSAHQYFRKTTGNRWYFFHNSFRQYLLKETSKDFAGNVDLAKDRDIQLQLAQLASEAAHDEPWKWEELYHRTQTGDDAAVIELASQSFFRQQFLSLKPVEDIRDDISLALVSAGRARDVVALTRLILIDAELSQRNFSLDRLDVAKLLVRLGELDLGIEQIRMGEALRLDAKDALKFSRFLARTEHLDEGRHIFDLAEPLDTLSGNKAVESLGRDSWEELSAWSRAAMYFRGIDQIITAINQIRGEADSVNQLDADENTERLRAGLLLRVGLELIALPDTEPMEKVQNSLRECGNTGAELLFRLLTEWCWSTWHAGDQIKAQDILDRLLAEVDETDLSNEELVQAAELVYRVKGDEAGAADLISDIQQPETPTDIIYSWESLTPFLPRLRLNRLKAALGESVDPTVAVPDPTEPRYLANVLFERALCGAARVWGNGWRGQIMTAEAVIRELTPALRFFNRSWQSTRDWTTWHSLSSTRREFFDLLVRAATEHGDDAVDALAHNFQAQWEGEQTARYWAPDVKREIAFSLARAGQGKTKLLYWLEHADDGFEPTELDERVSEGLSSAKAWIFAGEARRARESMKKMTEFSFGVRERKDYQFVKWMEWLGRANDAEPMSAGVRLARYAKGLAGLRDTDGSGLNEAAEEYLKGAIRWSPVRAVGLFAWLLEQRVIQHADGIRCFVFAGLEDDSPPLQVVDACVRSLLLPFQEGADEELARKITSVAWREKDATNLRNLIGSLLETSDTKAYPTNRRALRYAFISALNAVGEDSDWINLPPLPPKESEKSTTDDFRNLKLGDGTNLTPEEVVDRTKSFDDLVDLLKRQVDSEFFDWRRPIKKIVGSMSLEQTRRLVREFPHGERSVPALDLLSKRLAELGYLREALEIAESMIAISNSMGWSRYYDGGSRRIAFERLIALDSENGRERAFDTLIEDIFSGLRHFDFLLGSIEEILPLLTTELPILELWQEIEEHVGQLNELKSTLVEQLPDPASVSWEVREDTNESALITLLANHLTHPISEVATGAHKALYDIIVEGGLTPIIQQVISDRLAGDEPDQLHALIVLDNVCQGDRSILEPFSRALTSLCSSTDFAVRKLALGLNEILGYELPDSSRTQKTLPPIYSLHLPPADMATPLTPLSAVAPGDPLPDTDIPSEMVTPLGTWFEMLSGLSGYPLHNLCRRAVELMRQLAPESEWNAAAERQRQDQLGSAGLKIPFSRPRVEMARRGFNHVIAELVDSGKLNDTDLRVLSPVLKYCDSRMLRAQPMTIPPSVSLPAPRGFGSVSMDWLSNDEIRTSRLLTEVEGLIVIGEMSRIQELSWETPEEQRFSMICSGRLTLPSYIDDVYSFFPSEAVFSSDEYPRFPPQGSLATTVIRGSPMPVEVGEREWLCLNPTVGLSLGWEFASDGLFRWIGSDGSTMAESIWWSNGPLMRRPPRFDEVVSQGWIVVAAPRAIAEIEAKFGGLKRIGLIVRRFRSQSDHQEYKNHVSLEDEIVARPESLGS